MSRYADVQLVSVVIAIDDRVGLTLWAPPWVARDGDEEQGFLGDGRQVLAFASANELAGHLAQNPRGDLSEHPAWPSVLRRQVSELRAESGNFVDFDDMFTLLSADPTVESCDAVSKAVQLAEAIASSCGDDEVIDVLDRESYQRALLGSAEFTGRTGVRDWAGLAVEVTTSWEWVLERLARHIRWVGDVTRVDLEAIQQRSGSSSPWLGVEVLPTGQRGPGYGPAPLFAVRDLPSRVPTVVVTLLFGLFGFIPAVIATNRARAEGVRTGRYWAAFWWTVLVSFLAWVLLVVLLVSAASSGSG
jgi:hypothetical protein